MWVVVQLYEKIWIVDPIESYLSHIPMMAKVTQEGYYEKQMDCNPLGQNCSGAGGWYTLYHYLPTVKNAGGPSSRLKQTQANSRKRTSMT